ncbi:hypothetical protein NPIL_511691, partial [Nephila pilipes]
NKSTAQSYSEESKMKKMKSKSSKTFCNDKNTFILQDHDEKIPSGYLPGETKSNKKSSSTKRSLTHVKEKTYVCDKCGKKCRGQYDLDTHRRIHTKEKPFKCPTCGRQFSLKGDLNRHLYIHSGERSYVCDTCGMSFNRMSTLTHHRRRHTGERSVLPLVMSSSLNVNTKLRCQSSLSTQNQFLSRQFIE